MTGTREPGWVPLVPVVFVLLWSSGFIFCKAALVDSGPFTLLFLRFGLAALLMAAIAVTFRAPWPGSWREVWHVVVAGILMQATYLGPNFYAVSQGVPVGMNALVGALQPLLTAVLASRFMGERVRPLQWAGLVLGIAGIAMVVSDKVAFDLALWPEFAGTLGALVSITVGTLYQKHYCPRMDLRSGPALQFAVAAVIMAIPLVLLEGWQVEWTANFTFSLGYLVLLSAVIYAILIWLFRRGASTRVASLFFLVPPVTSAATWLIFDERLGPLALVGMVLTVVAVALATRKS